MHEWLEWVPSHLGGRMPQEHGPGRGNEGESPIDGKRVDDVVAPLNEGAVLLLALVQRLILLLPLGDVAGDDIVGSLKRGVAILQLPPLPGRLSRRDSQLVVHLYELVPEAGLVLY